MPKAVTTQMPAAEPPRDHDDMVPQVLSFEHAKDDQARSGFAVIVLDHLIARNESPGIMGSLGKSLVALQLVEKASGLDDRSAGPAGNRVLRATISNDVVENDHEVLGLCRDDSPRPDPQAAAISPDNGRKLERENA